MRAGKVFEAKGTTHLAFILSQAVTINIDLISCRFRGEMTPDQISLTASLLNRVGR